MPTHTITPPCHHPPPFASLGGARAHLSLSQKGRLLPNAESRMFGVYGPVLKPPFPSSYFKGRGNTLFSCDKFTKGAWRLEVSLCSVQHGEADLALLSKLFQAAKTGYCCEAFQPTGGMWLEWQKTGVTDCWWEQVEPTEEMKFGLELVG